MTLPAHVPLVVATRGDAVENVHHGSIAVADLHGRLLHSAGDPGALTFTRSTLKPFQALPFVVDGGPAAFRLGPRELATMCASHSGEAFHLEAVDAILGRSGNPPARLRCGCHVPYVYETTGRAPPADARFDARHHNCSGKHAGFLAWCTLRDAPHDGYLEPAHPLQARVRDGVASLLGTDPGALVAGTDGCSAPNLAMPLASLARLWAMLAAGAGSGDAAADAALATLRDAMVAHPEQVSGTGRSDLAFAAAGRGDWVAKVGADGVQVVGVRSLGLGIAVKIAGAHSDARFVAAVEVLRALGLAPPDAPALARWTRMPIVNAAGRVTGALAPAFGLRAH